ncbi:hypothetical protein AURDEDRAFT_121776 [Auricularia subglabra TFB-10046 SS5]|nr:hypothetical protein AURDEDRAFT_121776 [Auricularia subglabra TFB-10046 SS5]
MVYQPPNSPSPSDRPPSYSETPHKPVFATPPSPTKRTAQPLASPKKPSGSLPAVRTPGPPAALPSRVGRQSPVKLQPTPGGVPKHQKVTRQPFNEEILWPAVPPRTLLSNQAAADWEQRRSAAGYDTTWADHTAARAHQNDFIIYDLEHYHHPAGELFHTAYELNQAGRKSLLRRGIRDLKRTAYALECQTEALVLIYVVSANQNPNDFERVHEGNSTVVRHKDPASIPFKYRHVPKTHRVNNMLGPEWAASYNKLENFIKTRLAKPHVELWGTRRWVAGHPGTLAGSQQPFAEDYDDADSDAPADDDDDLSPPEESISPSDIDTGLRSSYFSPAYN